MDYVQQWRLNKWIESLGEEYIVRNKELKLELLADTASGELGFDVTADNLKTAIECVFNVEGSLIELEINIENQLTGLERQMQELKKMANKRHQLIQVLLKKQQ